MLLDTPSYLGPLGAGENRNLPALAQTFRERANGEALVVVVNHLKSDRSPCGPGDDDPVQGSCAAVLSARVREPLASLAGGTVAGR